MVTGGPVRVQVPASVAFNLGKFQQAIGNLVESLGCPKCFSGYDCGFARETRFVVDPKTLKVANLAGSDPMPAIGAWPTPERAVTVALPADVAYDVQKVKSVMKDLMGRLGHPDCHSGFDISYRIERSLLVNPRTLEVEPVGGAVIGDM